MTPTLAELRLKLHDAEAKADECGERLNAFRRQVRDLEDKFRDLCYAREQARRTLDSAIAKWVSGG